MRPLHRNLVVRRYTLPETSPGGIIIPEAFKGDRTATLWEVIDSGPCVGAPCAKCRAELAELEDPWKGLGIRLKEDDIIVTVGWTALELPASMGDAWIVDARHVRAVYGTSEEEE